MSFCTKIHIPHPCAFCTSCCHVVIPPNQSLDLRGLLLPSQTRSLIHSMHYAMHARFPPAYPAPMFEPYARPACIRDLLPCALLAWCIHFPHLPPPELHLLDQEFRERRFRQLDLDSSDADSYGYNDSGVIDLTRVTSVTSVAVSLAVSSVWLLCCNVSAGDLAGTAAGDVAPTAAAGAVAPTGSLAGNAVWLLCCNVSAGSRAGTAAGDVAHTGGHCCWVACCNVSGDGLARLSYDQLPALQCTFRLHAATNKGANQWSTRRSGNTASRWQALQSGSCHGRVGTFNDNLAVRHLLQAFPQCLATGGLGLRV